MVLLQYAQDDGDIILWDVWKEPIDETIDLLEWIASQEVCGFNLAFDWFHISKLYTTFSLFQEKYADKYCTHSLFNEQAICPENHINEIGVLEEQARFHDWCIKPKAACDIMLHARKGPYQSLMPRKDIIIKRIPSLLSDAVRDELEKRIELDGIYFAKRQDPTAPQWQIRDVKDSEGEVDHAFKNIVLKFHPSGQLKELAKHALGIEEDLLLRFTDIQPHTHWKPVELGYAPFALAIGNQSDWKGTWPEVIRHYISHWANNPLARQYAGDDVKYTRDLWKHFECPEPGDDDSELACAVAAARWRGFKIDIPALEQRKADATIKQGNTPTAPNQVKAYLFQVMDDTEQSALKEGTKAMILESIAGKKNEYGEWDYSKGWLKEENVPHPAAVRAREVLEARRAGKEIELYDKLLKAKRFHASLKVIGTLSSRMSGADDLNPQGIKSDKAVRACFPLADFDAGFVLSGGDFVSFEVVLAEAVYKDPKLREDLLAGKSIHGLFAEELFGIAYDTIMETRKTSTFYTDGKRGIFSQLYGGNEHTISERLDVPIETATKASEGFMDRYPGIRKAREKIYNNFCSMRQPGGIGSAVEWHKPAEYAEAFEFKRYFTLENKICKALFDLAQDPPKKWKDVRVKVRRRERLQTASGSCQSALFAAAFNIQAQNMRAAANHEIQSRGAQITKAVQRRIWDIQPSGVHCWIIQTLNVHDEVHTVTRPEHVDHIAEVVDETVKSFLDRVPLLQIEWNKKEQTWADK